MMNFMEKIYFDNDTYIWKGKVGKITDKHLFLKEAEEIIKSDLDNTTDGFAHKNIWNQELNFLGKISIETKLDEIVQIGIDSCMEIYKEKNIIYNKVNACSWINVVRSTNPIQIQFKHEEIKCVDKFHIHTDISREENSFIPNYTFVYYIQMPDVMNGEDGVLYFKGKNENEYWIRPEEDDLIIMEGDMPHSPNNAPNSTIDRIVLAGNVGFDFIKKENTLI